MSEMVQTPQTAAISMVERLARANALAKWRADIKWLGSERARGHRNPWLCSVARNGIVAGLTPEQVAMEMQKAGGRIRPLSENECRRAVEAVLRGQAPERRPAYASDGGAFWRRMLAAGKGITERDLMGKLPCRREQCLLQMRAVFDACVEAGTSDGFWWSGRDKFAKRDRSSLQAHYRVSSHTPLHRFVIANPLTGEVGRTCDGKESFVCKAALAAAPLVVCEFDKVVPEEQLRFWSGVLAEGALDVRSIVWSGSKSYHALVKVPSECDRAEFVGWLESVLPGVDLGPLRNVASLMRLAGGVNEKTGQLQRLVWASP